MARHVATGPSGLPIVQGIELVSVQATLTNAMRTVFPYPFFNAMQSKCVPYTYLSDDNFVVSAPTGSGKTVILELAICRLMSSQSSNGNSRKIVYQAPTKALCSERHRDWSTKFSAFGLRVEELTGDTESASLKHAQSADIIITTPEKWDSVTRKWKDHRKLMDLISLFLIDEVHILKEDRGASLEAVVSRMKSTGNNIRFIALSATVPNLDDIAKWLGKNAYERYIPAPKEMFGEDFRPVRLQKHVVGLSSGGSNEYQFDLQCTSKLPIIIARYAQGKPILVFCFTRNSTEHTANELASWKNSQRPPQNVWPCSPMLDAVSSPALQGCVQSGVAFHHAGLEYADRLAIEKAYRAGQIGVICCTSTLATGVNLPCHFVIIKNTVTCQQDAGVKEYSDLEIIQMLGRAGRPQYDRDAIAVIITRQEKVRQYENLVTGQDVIESRLHLNLIDHLNAELCLGTIHDLASAKEWLSSTFLFTRLTKNPSHYHVEGNESGHHLNERAERICRKGLASLSDYGLIHGGEKIATTEIGQAMARYYVHFESMKLFLGLQPKAKLSEILSAVAQSYEFRQIRFRSGDKGLFKEINKSSMTRFPIKVDLAIPAHRVSLIVQATLGGIDLKGDKRFSGHMQQFFTDQHTVFQQANRLVKCIIDCQVELADAISVRNALELDRSLAARAWDDSPMQLTQLEGIGPVAVRKLAAANVSTLEELEGTNAFKIDMTLSRNPPFGANLLMKLKEIPKPRVSLRKIGQPLVVPNKGVALKVNAEIGFLNEWPPTSFKKRQLHLSFVAEASNGSLVHFSRMSAHAVGRGSTINFTACLTSHEQLINCYLSCDEVAGTLTFATMKPKIPANMFIALSTIINRQAIGQAAAPAAQREGQSVKAKPTAYSGEDFGDSDIDDLELIDATQRDFDDIGDEPSSEGPPIRLSGSVNTTKAKASLGQSAAPTQESHRLPNGKWSCFHTCKNKDRCRHLCCNEGLDKPPKPRKKDTNTSNTHLKEYQGFTSIAKPANTFVADSGPNLVQANTQKKRIPSGKTGQLQHTFESRYDSRQSTQLGIKRKQIGELPSREHFSDLSPFNSRKSFVSSSNSPLKAPIESIDLSSDGLGLGDQHYSRHQGFQTDNPAVQQDVEDYDDDLYGCSDDFQLHEPLPEQQPETQLVPVLTPRPRDEPRHNNGPDLSAAKSAADVQPPVTKQVTAQEVLDQDRVVLAEKSLNAPNKYEDEQGQKEPRKSQSDIDAWILQEFGDVVEFV